MKPHHRPLARHKFVSTVSFILLFAAFLLLLLVALSLTIIKPVYLVSVKSTINVQQPTSIATELRFGVWGVCASSALSQPSWFGVGECFGPMLGYDIPQDIVTLAGVSPLIVQAVERGLLFVLVLHPIAAGLSFIGFIFAFFLGSHGIAIFTLIVVIIAGIVSTVVFSIDLALVIVIRNKIIDEIPYHFRVDFGPGVWMVFASVVMTWLAVVFLSARSCYCCGVKRYHDNY